MACGPPFEPVRFVALFALAVLVFAFLTDADVDDVAEVLLAVVVLRGLCRREGAFVFVVLGRVLKNAPRTSSSGSCALTANKPQARATTARIRTKGFDL